MRVFMVDLTCRTLPYDIHLVEALSDIGLDVELWLSGCLPEQQRETDARALLDVSSRVRGRRLRSGIKACEYLVNLVQLHWNLRVDCPDIVHFQWVPLAESIWPVETVNLGMARRNGAGVVYTTHNVLPHDTGDRHRPVFEDVYGIPDAIICHTERCKSELVADFGVPSEKVWIIPHGPLSKGIASVPREQARKRLGLDMDRPICLLFGGIRPYKGVEFLIESWKLVRDVEPSALLVLAGRPEPKYEETLSDKIEALGLESCIETSFERLPQSRLNLYIQAADILVYPYRDVTQSGALLTGGTTGKPIVATKVGGMGEMIRDGETGVLVEYGDEAGLAGSLSELIRDPRGREKLGQAAKEMIEAEYSWDAIARRTLECYRSVTE